MATTDIGEPSPRENQRASQRSDEVRSEIRQLLKSWAERTGFPLDELDRLQAKRQAAPPRRPGSRAPVSPFLPDEEVVAFRQALEKNRELLRSLSPPTTFITLDHPDTIDLIDDPLVPAKLLEKSIGPFSSFARLLVNIGGLPISSSQRILATYKWTNNISENLAVINVQTLLQIRGSYDIFAKAGLFDGNTNELDISAQSYAFVNGMLSATLGFETLTDKASAGGIIFGDDNVHVSNIVSRLFGFETNMMVVPAGADVSFFVVLQTTCSLDDDAALGDEIDVNFSSTDQVPFPIYYPLLTIQVLAS